MQSCKNAAEKPGKALEQVPVQASASAIFCVQVIEWGGSGMLRFAPGRPLTPVGAGVRTPRVGPQSSAVGASARTWLAAGRPAVHNPPRFCHEKCPDLAMGNVPTATFPWQQSPIPDGHNKVSIVAYERRSSREGLASMG